MRSRVTLWAAEHGVPASAAASQGNGLTHILAAVFFLVPLNFLHRSFYKMRIGSDAKR